MALDTFIALEPIFQYRIWGGEQLKTVLHKNYTENNIGESWEVSAVPGFESRLEVPIEGCENLKMLIKKFPEAVLGRRVFEKYGADFPLLIKFIDAREPLSIQVHPDDAYAREHHNTFGKNEMWYVMAAEEGAEIVSGFTKPMDLQQYRDAVARNNIENILQTWKVKKGDAIFLPAGRVHAIGAGILLAEIQQTSDVTYRIYDYNRTEKDGRPRELHHDSAEKVIDYHDTQSPIVPRKSSSKSRENLVNCPYFTTNLLEINEVFRADYQSLDSFIILIMVEGAAEIQSSTSKIRLNMGQTILLPAALSGEITFQPEGNCKVLEVYIPR